MSELKVDLRYLPVSKPTKEDDGSIVPAVESSKLHNMLTYAMTSLS